MVKQSINIVVNTIVQKEHSKRARFGDLLVLWNFAGPKILSSSVSHRKPAAEYFHVERKKETGIHPTSSRHMMMMIWKSRY